MPSRDGTAAPGMRGAIESKVDSLDDRVDEVFDDRAGELLVDEVEERW
jgi:hypothetical protein